MKQVNVYWDDAYTVSGWSSKLELMSNLQENKGYSVSTGFIFYDSEDKIALVQTNQPNSKTDDEESLDGMLVIPKGMIKSIKVVQEVDN